MISITTTGFGDIAPVSDRSRLIEAVIVTPIRIAVLFIFVGAAYNFVIKRRWEKWRMARIQEKLSDHIVVLGFGVTGSEAVRELIARGTDPPASWSWTRSRAPRRGRGDGLQRDPGRRHARRNLIAVRIDKARTVLVSAGRDDTSILIVLTAATSHPKCRSAWSSARGQ